MKTIIVHVRKIKEKRRIWLEDFIDEDTGETIYEKRLEQPGWLQTIEVKESLTKQQICDYLDKRLQLFNNSEKRKTHNKREWVSWRFKNRKTITKNPMVGYLISRLLK